MVTLFSFWWCAITLGRPTYDECKLYNNALSLRCLSVAVRLMETVTLCHIWSFYLPAMDWKICLIRVNSNNPKPCFFLRIKHVTAFSLRHRCPYKRDTVCQDGWTVKQPAPHQHPETEAAELSLAIIRFITPVLFLLWHVKMSAVKKTFCKLYHLILVLVLFLIR